MCEHAACIRDGIRDADTSVDRFYWYACNKGATSDLMIPTHD